MRISIIVEGAYPYVNGGVSGWVQNLMLNIPEHEFIVQCIGASRDNSRQFKYRIPDNCIQIQEVYLMDDDYISDREQKRVKLSPAQYDAFEALMFGEKTDWDIIMDYFKNNNVSLNALLAGKDFLSMSLNYYEKHFERVLFTDFLWSMRSMYLPLFTILKSMVEEVDLYHSVSAGYAGIWASLQKSVFHKPFIMSEHGIYTREREEEIIKADWVKGVYKDLWIKQFRKIGDCCYQYADIVTSLFKDARDYQLELGCDSKKAIITPNGVNPQRFTNSPQKDPDDKFINIGALLRVTPIKDVKTMINAFAFAKQKNNRLKLWIMGDMDESPEYARECIDLVKELDINDVIFTGIIDANDYIGKMDMLILSSLSEGQPLSILEAFTAQKPVIATNVGNCRGLIEGEYDDYGNAGLIVPVMNSLKMAGAILKLAEDADLRKKMGETGLKRVKSHYVDKECYGIYRDLYNELGTKEK